MLVLCNFHDFCVELVAEFDGLLSLVCQALSLCNNIHSNSIVFKKLFIQNKWTDFI